MRPVIEAGAGGLLALLGAFGGGVAVVQGAVIDTDLALSVGTVINAGLVLAGAFVVFRAGSIWAEFQRTLKGSIAGQEIARQTEARVDAIEAMLALKRNQDKDED